MGENKEVPKIDKSYFLAFSESVPGISSLLYQMNSRIVDSFKEDIKEKTKLSKLKKAINPYFEQNHKVNLKENFEGYKTVIGKFKEQYMPDFMDYLYSGIDNFENNSPMFDLQDRLLDVAEAYNELRSNLSIDDETLSLDQEGIDFHLGMINDAVEKYEESAFNIINSFKHIRPAFIDIASIRAIQKEDLSDNNVKYAYEFTRQFNNYHDLINKDPSGEDMVKYVKTMGSVLSNLYRSVHLLFTGKELEFDKNNEKPIFLRPSDASDDSIVKVLHDFYNIDHKDVIETAFKELGYTIYEGNSGIDYLYWTASKSYDA